MATSMPIVSDAQVAKFKGLYLKIYGIRLSDEDAGVEARRFISVFASVSKALDENEDVENEPRETKSP